MPVHVVETEVAAAAATTISIAKPTQNKVHIKHVSVYTKKALEFAHWDGHLYLKSGATSGFKALFNTILPNTYLQGHLVFDGDVEWPHDWLMAVTVFTQTADEVVYVSIDYEIIPPPAAGWGG